ncbi:phytoene desaturase family protein [Roseimicrobium sp. ORNL1]|uniref:phytoene desaturase family protein n=1 Tax=Roseimicrobium sp. ORNL1 TaxID=2711231 RepID=UPI0013E1669D|nr:phytoene desaturase family protein [Roseimicrobium sp. ORNL1]QIF02890.1 phytoene desaturase [Roseimicrobium sp. ORNL1]
MAKPKRVLIIGAGPGGLATAMLLAKEGLEVTVLEKQPRVGGRTSCIEGDGYRFDLGPTFFLYPQVLQEIFQAVGKDLFTEVPMQRLDPQYRITFGAGGEINATSDIERMCSEIARLSPEDAPRFRQFMAHNRVKLEKFAPCLQTPFQGWTSLLSARLLAVLPFLKPWKSLHQELADFFHDPRLQLAFTFQSKYLGMSPFQCPSLFSILSFLEYEHGIWHPTGGCSALTENMARIARELGVKIHLDTAVEQIIFTGKRAVGVRTKHGEELADAVVVNADFAHAMSKLVAPQLRRKWSDATLSRKRYSCSTFMLYLGVEGRFENLTHHNIYVAKDYRRNLQDIEERHVLSDDPSFYVANTATTDDTMAPRGHSALYVLLPVTHQHPNVDWNKEKMRYRSLALKQLAKIGVPDIEKRIRFERIITPQDWEQKVDIYRGATFNLAHSFSQMLHLRPRNRFEEFDGMYLVGGGTHPGSGLPVIFESARISSRLLLEDLA